MPCPERMPKEFFSKFLNRSVLRGPLNRLSKLPTGPGFPLSAGLLANSARQRECPRDAAPVAGPSSGLRH